MFRWLRGAKSDKFDGIMDAYRRLISAAAVSIVLVAPGCITENKFPDRFSKAICDKLDECDANVFPDCEDMMKAAAEDTLDECDSYKGSLAHKCVKEIKDLSCNDSIDSIGACEDFDEECGVGEQGIEYADGLTVRGLSHIEYNPPTDAR